MLTVETRRTTQEAREQEERQRGAPGFERVATAAISPELNIENFGRQCAKVRDLFRQNPSVFEGMNIADGTNLPRLKNVFVAILLGEPSGIIRAG